MRCRAAASADISLPEGARVGPPIWSADGKRFAFHNLGANSVELWVGDANAGTGRPIAGVRLNPFLGRPILWLPDQKTLLVRAVPEGLAAPPAQDAAPSGPAIQQTSGQKGASSTYELRDVLKSPKDEELFDYYAATQLVLVDTQSDRITPLGKPDLYEEVLPSPDGSRLLVSTTHRPYSYVTAYRRFPREVDIWDLSGRPVYHLASLPLADRVPIWGVPTGPRKFQWRENEPATLVWNEALDGGDWKNQVPHRDRIVMLKAPLPASRPRSCWCGTACWTFAGASGATWPWS